MDEKIVLEVNNLNAFYGNIHVLRNISFKVPKGSIVTLIGANGAGKSTTLKSISGMMKIKSGEIKFCNEIITNQSENFILKKGIAHVAEGRRIFQNLTVEENLELGGFIKSKTEVKEQLENSYKMFPLLYERRKQIAGTLSGGEQQMLAISRALMSKPKLIMMDEPSMGLAPILVKQIFDIIKTLNENGVTILLVEQNAKMALSIADQAYVLETGHISMEGKAKDLMNDDRVKSIYLGGN